MFFGHSRGLGLPWHALGPANNCTSRLDLSNELLNAPNGDCMQNCAPWEVDTSTNHLGAHKPFGASPPRFRVLDL
jgi:hypothetical protein